MEKLHYIGLHDHLKFIFRKGKKFKKNLERLQDDKAQLEVLLHPKKRQEAHLG